MKTLEKNNSFSTKPNWFQQRISNIKQINDGIEWAISPDLTLWKKIGINLDYFLETKLHGIQLIDYLQYGFYWKSKPERRKFVCRGEARKILRECNDDALFHVFDRKAEFNEMFSAYLGREWLDVTSCSFDEFQHFIQRHHKVFVKPEEGSYGIGAGILVDDGELQYEALYQDYQASQVLMEEVVEQNHEMAAFNDTSVNTLRVVTFLKADGSVKITAAVLRLGRKGYTVDNFHFHGIAALIDIETGIVKTTGIDRDFVRYVTHPDSGKPIVGFQIPNWEKIVETVKKAAHVVPGIHYTGWDIAIGADGQVIVIEGNKSADHDVTQVTDQIGKWPIYQELLAELGGGKTDLKEAGRMRLSQCNHSW